MKKEGEMKKLSRLFFIVIIGSVLAISIGCVAKPKYSGFLSDYSGLKEGPMGGADLVYIKKGVDFSKYDKIMMDHVVLYFKQDAEYKGIHADELKELSDAFHKEMVDALKGAYPMVDKPGPGVLRIRPAITDVVPSKPVLNTVSSVMPIGLGISIVKRVTTGVHAGVGQATLEAEFLDSQTDARLAAVVDRKAAEKFKVIEGMNKWGHAKDAFKFWAKRLRSWMDEQHGR
jgi:hypothetical protein